ncbi:hypothetical protein A5742_08630 [Mycolicibacterium fortuitum]|uniref:Uncharacterized protein n=1 Tax=Mycolicibacterium fortuitum TaxID=1766 RepID=A0ABD6QGT0_MYCFO|nr:hypothetical protein [Mycolicibacterium fortuitum]OMC37690.1 hypothetical protein A5742_08630 [Mycolicibacterium fortuitum]
MTVESAAASLTLTIRVENAYSDGHTSKRVETVEVEPFEDLEQLWEQLEEFTGDGHGIGNDLGYCFEITIVDAPGRCELVGEFNEWVGA